MRPSEVLEQNRKLVRDMVARSPARNPRVFGSVLHGTDTEDSDIDILVDAPAGTTMLHLIGLERELRDRLGVRVQVLTPGDLGRRFRDRVLAEAQPI
ncbi:nucleotidyltransferase [Devosia insulae DS-56]|uniref:Nucleotidyltransferase n=1 Tax=Devosia insulae DS-56 TaxID=1116389 RepID=A0A1E5XIY5_9HYPH|nr:nucleotidyltransferase family protein [Devosia insulae]OEO28563.1 nucleotidyltransferase [Devosia insulae DS-56]